MNNKPTPEQLRHAAEALVAVARTLPDRDIELQLRNHEDATEATIRVKKAGEERQE